jgi:hypothetical protein
MTRSHMGALLALLTVALCTRIAAAQTTTPTATPMASPMSAPAPAAAPAQVPAATPSDTPAAAPAASPAAAPAASPASAQSQHGKNGHALGGFLAGDYLWGTFSKNQFNTLGENDKQSFAGRGALTYKFGKYAVMAEGTYDHFQYLHQTAPVEPIGGGPAPVVPEFLVHNTDWDGRVGIGLPYPRTFLVASYGQRQNNFGLPNLQGFGFGIEKLPSFKQNYASFFGSYLWYPEFGSGGFVQYGLYKYSFGIEIHAPKIPVFVEFGVIGDYAYAKKNAPTYLSDSGVITGIGVHF